MSATIAGIRLADLLHVARARGASDVHVGVGAPPAIRVNGELEFLAGSPLDSSDMHALARTLLGEIHVRQVEEGTECSTMLRDGAVGAIRVHAFRVSGEVALALRLLPNAPPDLDSLRLPPVVARFTRYQHGLVVVAGPTGSGKSTTLAALIDRMNTTLARRILTIEDPIEFRHRNKRSFIAQREVGVDVLSVASAIIGSLRADPDVIVIGEMRDAEAIRAALRAAETGHLVFATLHTGNASQSVDRIVDAFFGEEQVRVRAQLAQTLAAVVAQRLIKREDGAGRAAIAEVLVATDAVRTVIRDGRTHQLHHAISTGRSYGMQTFDDAPVESEIV